MGTAHVSDTAEKPDQGHQYSVKALPEFTHTEMNERPLRCEELCNLTSMFPKSTFEAPFTRIMMHCRQTDMLSCFSRV